MPFNLEDESIDSPHLAPHQLCYHGTHDNNTVLEIWYRNEIDDQLYVMRETIYTNRKVFQLPRNASLPVFHPVSFMANASHTDSLLELDEISS